MSAVLFWKKRVYLVITGIISTILVCVCTVYAYTLMGIQTIDLNKTFYFLVTKTTHVEASTHEIELSGGEGYYLEVNEEGYVTFSVYLNETDSQTVLAKVDSVDKNVRILTMRVKKFIGSVVLDKNANEVGKVADVDFNNDTGAIETVILTLQKNIFSSDELEIEFSDIATIGAYVLLNKEIRVSFQVDIYNGACISTTILLTKSYLYLPDTNNLLCVKDYSLEVSIAFN